MSQQRLQAKPITGIAGSPKPSLVGLFVLLLGGFITVFDLFVVNVAIPAIKSDLGASFGEISFVVAGYQLAFGVLLIAGGRLGDAHGRRRLFSLGMLAFSVASLLCGVAPSVAMLIVARLLQGLSGALLFPQVYALLRVLYDDIGRRRAFGLLGMTLGLAAIAGQLLGGCLVQLNLFGLGWRVVFLVNLPIGVFAALLSIAIPESKVDHSDAVDWLGVALATLTLVLLMMPLLEGSNAGWPLWTWGSLAGSVIAFSAFIAWERRAARIGASPAVDLKLFRNAGFSIGSLAVLLIYSTASSLFLCFALLMQSGLGLSPFEAGALFAPASVGFVAASLIAPKAVERLGNRAIVGGTLIYALGIAWLSAGVSSLSGRQDATHLLPALIFFGFGQGLSMTPLLNLVVGFVEERYAGIAAGIVSTMQQVGAAIGVSIVSIFFAAILAGHQNSIGIRSAPYIEAFCGAMIYNLAAAIVAALLLAYLIYGGNQLLSDTLLHRRRRRWRL